MRASYLIGAIILLACSGVPGVVMSRRSSFGQHVATALAVVGSALGVVVALCGLADGRGGVFEVRGPLGGTSLHFRLDALSAFFLVPIFVLGACGSVYGERYWRQREHLRTGRRLRLCYGLLLAAMAVVVVSADAIAFLFAWEVMALSAFFLVCTEEHKREVRAAGWLYLVATHVSTLLLFALFALWRSASGTFEFRPVDPQQAGLGLRTVMFLVALGAFGFKAGMMPFHFWLPSAHANAPSHVSAILSGVLLKIGIYGLLRTLTLLGPPPAGWGCVVLALGALSAVLGVLFAVGQHDLKRLLAYHSVENIGIILMGLGLALLGEARGRIDWVVLGMGGCLLHVWNHALFKSLLFFAAGSVVHAVRTREIDQMGSLAKRQPVTALMFFIGAAAICGLPPLNGFLSELFIYLGLFHTLDQAPGAALAAPALALVGALAVACFVKAYGAVFLGSARSAAVASAHEAPLAMTLPMCLLALCCVAIGSVPTLTLPALDAVVGQWTAGRNHGPMLAGLAPIRAMTPISLTLTGLLVLGFVLARARWPLFLSRQLVTWDCGYARPSARMQYTASSFAATLVRLFRSVLRPCTHAPDVGPMFPSRSRFQSHVDDVVLDGFLTPMWQRVRSSLGWMRALQQGSVQSYVLYILLILTLLLFSVVPVGSLITWFAGGDPR